MLGKAIYPNISKTADQLTTARTVQTDLASNTSASFDGTENINPGVKGTLAIKNGGTNATSADAARQNIGAAPAYTYGTEDLVAGESQLAAGTLHIVYEP